MTSYVIKKGNKYWPSKAMKKIAYITDPKIYTQAEKNPVKFWGDLAKKGIVWEEPWEQKNTYVENDWSIHLSFLNNPANTRVLTQAAHLIEALRMIGMVNHDQWDPIETIKK